MSGDLASLGLVEVATRIREGSLSSLEVTTALLVRAARVQSRLNCFLEIDTEGARRAAAAAEEDESEQSHTLH